MGVQKKPKSEPSCPLWLATYGDMVTNMLVFFVLLLSMSEIKKEERFIEFMQAVREAFGYIGGMQHVPLEQILEVKNVDLAQVLIVPIRPFDMSQSPDIGVKGQQPAVTAMQRAPTYQQGGKIYFDELSAELSPAARTQITEYADKLRGYRTQVEVRGHCSRYPVTDSQFVDHFALSTARARAVAAALVEAGVSLERLVLVGAGSNEPVVTSAYTPAQRHENDRVELFEVSRYVGRTEPEPPTTQPATDVRAP